MVGAMLMLLLVVAAYVAFRSAVRESPPSPVHAVRYSAEASYARSQARFRVLAPPSLPSGWRATTVSFERGPREHWHLGLLTDKDRYVGLEQAELPAAAMAHTYVDKQARKGAPVTVAGATWDTWTDGSGDVALVRSSGTATTLVVGHDVPRAEVEAFTASLR